MNVVLTGMALGFVVSIPPGPNAMLCVNLACGGVRKAFPLITSAALTDAMYFLLAASGVLYASRASSELLAYLAPCFTIGAAALAWSPRWASPRAMAGTAVLNPSTAAIWIGLSSLPALRALSLSDVLARALPVALGTAVWFTLLATATARFSRRLDPRHAVMLQKLLATMLGTFGLLGLTGLIH